LHSIASSTFERSKLKAIFLPQSLRFMGHSAFSYSRRLSCVHFACHSSIPQLKSKVFSSIDSLRTVVIPASVEQIHYLTFAAGKQLSLVTLELPSKCWYLASAAFLDCTILKSIVLPHSVLYRPYSSIFCTKYSSTFCMENDCLLGANRGKLVQYQGTSKTFCMRQNFLVLSARGFILNDSLIALVFESQSCLRSLHPLCFYSCKRLCSVQIPKSVGVLCDHRFDGCYRLTKVTVESPASMIGQMRQNG
jgi:hypothetical protein